MSYGHPLMKNVSSDLMDQWLIEAAQSPRKRSHYNYHPSLDDPVQRLCIALCKGTYVRPHRHPQDDRWELIIALRGRTAMVTFDDAGKPQDKHLLCPLSLPAVECPPNTWHTLYPLDDESVIMEIKQGPYLPNQPEYFATWAPEENDHSAVLSYMAALQAF
jgi:cupin fold WbuC family metalloprotein